MASRSEQSETPPRARVGREVYVVAAAVIAVLLIAAVLTLPRDRGIPGQLGVLEGELAIDFTVRTLDGTDWTLSAHRGSVVVLSFMGAHCSTCAYESVNILRPVFDAYSARGVAMVSVDVNRQTSYLGGEDEEAVRQFAVTNQVAWPIALDIAGVAQTYRATGAGVALPTLLVIDGSGIIAERHTGILSQGDLTALLESLL